MSVLNKGMDNQHNRDFDQALIRDGSDDSIIPMWDGDQYIGGVGYVPPTQEKPRGEHPPRE